MTVFFFLLGVIQCFAVYFLGRAGANLEKRAERNREEAKQIPPSGWPACALIIPVAGEHPRAWQALASLCEQNYPNYSVCLVAASEDDPASVLTARLKDEFPGVTRVIAGNANGLGQKNHNLLAGARAMADKAEVFAFCDSTHVAEPDFLRCLVDPIAKGEAAFATGYHKVLPEDTGIITLAYCLTTFFMRCLQGINSFTQPWGGALAITKSAFIRHDVAKLWSTNVVDDCSLAGWLLSRGVAVRLCPGALLITYAKNHAAKVWLAWLERQILFLKFCVFPQWLALSLVCALMLVPPLWATFAILRGLFGLGGGMAPFLALLWLIGLISVLSTWRRYLPDKAGIPSWTSAFFCACGAFFLAYARSIPAKTILWHNILYRVGSGGKVLSATRLK